MQYLVTGNVIAPFLTHWFEPENNFNEEYEMVVYDLINNKYMTDGKTWHDIEIDHL